MLRRTREDSTGPDDPLQHKPPNPLPHSLAYPVWQSTSPFRAGGPLRGLLAPAGRSVIPEPCRPSPAPILHCSSAAAAHYPPAPCHLGLPHSVYSPMQGQAGKGARRPQTEPLHHTCAGDWRPSQWHTCNGAVALSAHFPPSKPHIPLLWEAQRSQRGLAVHIEGRRDPAAGEDPAVRRIPKLAVLPHKPARDAHAALAILTITGTKMHIKTSRLQRA